MQSQAVSDCVVLDRDAEEHMKYFEFKKKMEPGL